VVPAPPFGIKRLGFRIGMQFPGIRDQGLGIRD